VSLSLCDRVADSENLARYVLSDSWLYKDDRPGCPLKPSAFMPHPRIELSVYRIDDWSAQQIKARGNEVADARENSHRAKQIAQGKSYPANKRTFRNHGYGQILAGDVRVTGLDVTPKEPPIRHADIVRWPPISGNRKADEAAQLAYALRIQVKAQFVAS
jgi:hypothetical protein